MNQMIKKITILAGIFAISVMVYFLWNKNTADQTETVYTTMEEASLPVVYMEMFGKERNALRGYVQDLSPYGEDVRAVSSDDSVEALTILPEDRQLEIHIRENAEDVTGIRYEIRSMDMEHLVERTSLETWEDQDGQIVAKLPVQNLLAREEQYLLQLFLDTKTSGEVRYDTRILWTEDTAIQPMIELAELFSQGTLDPEQSDQLVSYLESNDSADNSNLGQVNIECSFDQITWGDLEVVRESQPEVTLKELDGIMSEIEISYLASRALENGRKEYFEVEEYFTMKWNAQRIYLMNYNRETNEIFSGDSSLFSEKRITLGIGDGDGISSMTSPNGNYQGFAVNRDLWVYDKESRKAVRVFSFRSGTDSGIRSNYNHHNVRLLSLQDDGSADFMVSGYMNRGRHEGVVGLAFYHYDGASNTIEEKFFAPVSLSFDQLEAQLRELTCFHENGMLYLMLGGTAYGIETGSGEYIVLEENLTEGRYAISEDGRKIAWQTRTEKYGSTSIHLMNLDSGEKNEVRAPEGSVLRPLGFLGSDFVYGLAYPGEEWIQNGRVKEFPMYALEIIDSEMNVATHYEPEGYAVTNVEVTGSRVYLDRVVKLSSNEYTFSDTDIIVCNEETLEKEESDIGWYASPEKKRVYFVQLDQEIPKNTRVFVSAPKKITYDHSKNLNLHSQPHSEEQVFYAYGNGKLQGICQDLPQAILMAYDGMGYVTDQNHRMMWNRVNRSPAKTLRNPDSSGGRIAGHAEGLDKIKEADSAWILDLRGCQVSQILYYIDQGLPVVAYTQNGDYQVIYGFDQYNISIYDPSSQTSSKMGLEDAAEYFASLGNDFVGGIQLP